MKICVTGASGKIGQAGVVELREHDHEVTAVDLHTVREHSGPTVVGGAPSAGQLRPGAAETG